MELNRDETLKFAIEFVKVNRETQYVWNNAPSTKNGDWVMGKVLPANFRITSHYYMLNYEYVFPGTDYVDVRMYQVTALEVDHKRHLLT